jgi:type IV pilus assembly protein PilC
MAEATAVKNLNFVWEGTDKKGNRIRGKTIAPNEAAVKADLRRQGIAPLKINKERRKAGKKITTSDISFFSRQMATMMSSGVPLVQSMDIIGKGHVNPAMQDLVMDIKANVEAGNNLADALAKHPLYFDDLFVNLVRAGEQAGALETLLDKIATYQEKTERIKKKIKKALSYPIAVLVVAFVVTGILLVFVIPQFEELFKGFGADLPAFTQWVVNLSRSVRSQGYIYVVVIGAAFGTFTYFQKRSRKFREFLDRISLKIPVVGEILTKSALARFARTLSTMFAAGVNLVDALSSVAGATGNIIYEQATLKMRDQISTGQQLNVVMSQTGLFPHVMIQMIAIGEEAGSIDAMSAKVADFYEEEVDNAVDNLTSLMEPLIMAVLGVLVGGLVVAMYLPIFKLGSVV